MGKPTVLVTDNISDVAKNILENGCNVVYRAKLSADELLEAIENADGLMVRSASKVTEKVLDKGKKLKIVGRAGVGTDNIDLKAATRNGVIVVNSPGGNTQAAAEHTMGMLWAMARHIPQADKTVKGGGWRTKDLVGVELKGKNLGVIGFGKIGRTVAMVFQRAGMQILVFDPFLSDQHAEEMNIQKVELDELYARSDFITIHAPKTPETEKMLNKDAFAKMKDGVRIVNCARGGIIEEGDLIEAIESGKVAAAALDVFEQEPTPPDNPLFKLGDKIITTPHLGASTEEAQINVARDVAEQILEYFDSGTAQSAVNIPALRKDILDPVRAYMPMAETMGNFLRQISPGGATMIEMVAGGELAKENLQPLLLATLKGLLGYAREGVNYVNALIVAEEEGIEVKESRSPKSGNYLNMITLILTTDKGQYEVSGSLIADTIYRIVNLNGYATNIQPSRYILLAPHIDKPGMIAKVATILGDHNINVSSLEVARKGEQAGGQSMMVFILDDPVPNAALEQITQVDGITDARFIDLES